jgi:hypothetical protein
VEGLAEIEAQPAGLFDDLDIEAELALAALGVLQLRGEETTAAVGLVGLARAAGRRLGGGVGDAVRGDVEVGGVGDDALVVGVWRVLAAGGPRGRARWPADRR